MATTLLSIAGGLALLVLGGDWLVRGASRIALRAGVAPLVVGLTIVAFGTSSPELVVSVTAALEGNAEIAVANVVGSNVFNVLFILGICAALAPLAVASQMVRREVPIMIGTSLLLLAFAWDGRLVAWESAVLLAGIVAYTAGAVVLARRETQAVKDEFASAQASRPAGSWAGSVAFVVVGLVLLVLGARWLVAGSVAVARALGVPDTVIGLTIVAAGTSLPEVAASVVATLRGERDIAVGNVVGSNIYNILAILGVSGLVAGPGGLPVSQGLLRFDIPVMIAVAVATLPIVFTGRRIDRWEGWLFLATYAAYVTYLVLDARGHDAAPSLAQGLLLFALPLVAVTLGVGAWRQLRRERAGAPGA
jgi:cation:H+ antiporter